jgi:hypothetical protein
MFKYFKNKKYILFKKKNFLHKFFFIFLFLKNVIVIALNVIQINFYAQNANIIRF